MDSFRLFIAIELPADVRRKIKQHGDRLHAELPDVRASWTREENLHLTLKFLGETPVEKVELLSDALKRAAATVGHFEMKVAGCGAFPSRGKPNVLWIGVTGAESSLARLHEAIETECASIGFARDTRPFHPHLTIARLRQAQGVRNLAKMHEQTKFDPFSVRVNSVCLIRSQLSSYGSRYSVISRQDLR